MTPTGRVLFSQPLLLILAFHPILFHIIVAKGHYMRMMTLSFKKTTVHIALTDMIREPKF